MASSVTPELQADIDASGAESRFVNAGGLRLHALDFGGDGTPVLVLPGITSPAITWQFVAPELSGVRPVLADMRGRGLSGAPADDSYALDDYAGDAAALIAGLGLERPVVLGHSLGARVAAVLAVRHPGVAGPLILVDPPLTGPSRDPYPTSLESFLTQLHEARAGTTADAVARHFPGWPRREHELRARWLATCEEPAVAETYLGFDREDFHGPWRELPQPAILVRGGRSPVVSEAGAAELAQLRPDIPIVSVPDAAHMVPWDNLPGFLEAIDPFLDENARTG
jgi:N-formylmaleamate deformylase